MTCVSSWSANNFLPWTWGEVPITAADLGSIDDPDAARENLGAAASTVPFGTSGHYGRLTHQPLIGGVLATMSLDAGRVYYFPCCPESDLSIVQWVVEITTTATLGAAITLRFARYAMGAGGVPGARVADYSATATINMDGAAVLTASSTFSAISIPRGQWYIAALPLGTDGIPTKVAVRALTGHPSVGAATMSSLNVNGGYRSPDTSNVGFPLNASIAADIGRAGLLLYGKHA